MIIGIMAVGKTNKVIANKGELPWDYPDELAFFKQTTANYPLIMGRKTFDVIPKKVFHTRKGIIFSKTLNKEIFKADNCILVNSIEEFLRLSKNWQEEKMFLIGGAILAKNFLALNLIDKFILTEINKTYEGDTFFDLTILKNWPKKQMQHTANYTTFELTNPMISY